MSKFFLIITSFVLAGCSFYAIDSQDTTLDFYQPKDSVNNVVYLEKVDQPHEIIGIASVDAERTRPKEEIVAKMKYEAAILGGDAITDIRQDSSRSSRAPSVFSNANIRTRYTAKVVVFK